jgi:hypothetical protein
MCANVVRDFARVVSTSQKRAVLLCIEPTQETVSVPDGYSF